MACALISGSSSNNALLVLEGKVNDVRTRGRPRRIYIDDIKEWSMWKTTANSKDRSHWRNLTRLRSITITITMRYLY